MNEHEEQKEIIISIEKHKYDLLRAKLKACGVNKPTSVWLKEIVELFLKV